MLLWLASRLGAAVMAAVMASDSQILALSTMFTEDVFTFYRGTARFGPAVQVQTGRLFVVVLTVVAYLIAFNDPPVADFLDPVLVKVVRLDQPCRTQQVHDGGFELIKDVPTHAFTLTIPALLRAKHVSVVVPGPARPTRF